MVGEKESGPNEFPSLPEEIQHQKIGMKLNGPVKDKQGDYFLKIGETYATRNTDKIEALIEGKIKDNRRREMIMWAKFWRKQERRGQLQKGEITSSPLRPERSDKKLWAEVEMRFYESTQARKSQSSP